MARKPGSAAPAASDTAPATAPVAAEASPTESAAPDISKFTAAAEAAVAASVAGTDDWTEVTKEYNALDRKGKSAATRSVNDAMSHALRVLKDKVLAIAWVTLGDAIKTKPAGEKKEKVAKTPVNPTEDFVERLATLSLAYTTAAADVPQGVDSDWTAKLEAKVAEVNGSGDIAKLVAYRKSTAEDKGDAPEVSELVSRVVRLASQGAHKKASAGTGTGRTYEGPKRSVSAHIAAAFEGKPSGTFLSVAEIKANRSEVYGDDSPSSGAVSAALKGKSLPEGISPANGGPKNTFGGVKA